MESKNIQWAIEIVYGYFATRFSGEEGTWWDLFCDERGGGLDGGCGGANGKLM